MTQDIPFSDDELQRQYYELKTIDEHLKKLENELSKIDVKISELSSIKGFVTEISTKSGAETLVPITDGIFVRAKLLEQGEFIVNVGSGVCVPKNTEDTLKLLSIQEDELNKYRTQITSKMETLDGMARNIENEFLRKDKEKNIRK
jgi:prefoldin alpha subunit